MCIYARYLKLILPLCVCLSFYRSDMDSYKFYFILFVPERVEGDKEKRGEGGGFRKLSGGDDDCDCDYEGNRDRKAFISNPQSPPVINHNWTRLKKDGVYATRALQELHAPLRKDIIKSKKNDLNFILILLLNILNNDALTKWWVIWVNSIYKVKLKVAKVSR